MDYFAGKGFDCWCVDMEGYGRSSKERDINCDIANGADGSGRRERLHPGAARTAGRSWSTASRRARCAPPRSPQRHPERVRRLALDAFVWTGEGSPTLAERRKKLAQFESTNRRPIDRAFVRSIFSRDHPGTADDEVVEAFAEAILALDDSVPTGTYVDMCAKLPVVDPERLTMPTIVMRGQYDGIAGFDDLLAFFKRLPNPDKQFAVMPGIAHASFQQKNYLLGLPHPGELLRPARPGLPWLTRRAASRV